jgi:hypothetical protein
MNKFSFAPILLATIFLTGCVVQPIKTINISSTFNSNLAKSLLKEGDNKIQGSALIRQAGGGVISCAGRKVHLIPKTEYQTERIIHLYGNETKGYNSNNNYNFSPEPEDFKNLNKAVLCDVQGYFEFDNVADGSFYIVSSIFWRVTQYRNEGGSLFAQVSVKNGETKKIIIAP